MGDCAWGCGRGGQLKHGQHFPGAGGGAQHRHFGHAGMGIPATKSNT